MLSSVTLADNTGADVTLHQDATNGKRWLTLATGLRGIQTLRSSKRVRPQAHGGINETRYEDGRSITLTGEIMSTISIEDAFSEFGLVAAPMIQTLDTGPALLKWQEGSGVVNLVTNPSFKYGTTGWTTTPPFGVAGATLVNTAGSGVGGFEGQVDTTATIHEGVAIPLVGTFLAGVPYTLSATLFGNAGGESINFLIGDAGAGDFSFATETLVSGWVRYSVTWTPSSNRTSVFVNIYTAVSAVYRFFVSGVMVTQSTSALTYFDGDSPDCEWLGAVGSSSSRSGHALQRLVKLDGDLDPPFQEGQAVLTYQAQFFSEDPRAYSQTLQLITGTALSASGGGRTIPTPFNYTYSSSGGGTASFTNAGNRPTPPIFRIYGMCVNPVIAIVGGSLKLSFLGTIANGDYLEIDVAKRTVKLNGASNRLNFLDSANTTWFELPKGTSNLQLIAGTFDGTARLDVLGRSAFA